MLGQLLKEGWTWQDIKSCTRMQLQIALILIKRMDVLEKGSSIPNELLREHPELVEVKAAAEDEIEKINKLRGD